MKTENSVLWVALIPLDCLFLFPDISSFKTLDLKPYGTFAVFNLMDWWPVQGLFPPDDKSLATNLDKTCIFPVKKDVSG